ncbi:P-loop containing nucleoside triphosphate hydrolase protein [Trichophaea hybrida]|nr:P-loop containing nucleoside triphosphate hydrolase protein [Trichophaea hybrida]
MASKSQVEKGDLSPTPNERSSSLDITVLKGVGIDAGIASLHEQPNDDDIIDSNPHISFRRVEAVNVSVRNLAISFSQRSNLSLPWRRNPEEEGKKVIKILENVSTDIPAGKLMAIIGSSGSGKTSMLNVMAHRMRGQNLDITGTTTFNDSHILSSIRHAYVMQQDVLLPTLTVRETLQYSAELRLPSGTTLGERERVVEEVILQLGLKECANTPIGDSAHKGCSGGEKRRVSIGVQLLSNPSVLFLDEPTTGLDATSAFQLVRTLKNLAKKGRTIITTLHQPRSEIWGLFDRITIVARGSLVFSGKVSAVEGYFDSIGYPFPQHINPADFLIDLSAVDYRSPEAEAASIERVNALIASWQDHESQVLSPNASTISLETAITSTSVSAGDVQSSVAKPPFWRQVSVLTRRTFKTTYRDPMGLFGCLIEATMMAIIAGWIFYQINGSLSGIRSRQAALYMAVSLQGYLILLFEMYRLCEVDIRVFDREHGEGVVGVLAFMISRRIAKMFLEDIPVPAVFSVIYYFMCGFDRDATQFFTFFALLLLIQYLSVSFATLCVGLSRNFGEASLIGNLSFTVQSLASGFFIQAATLPVYVRWTKYISYNWYALGAFMANEFSDKFYDCPLEGGRNNPACLEYDGNFILDSLSFSPHWIKVPIAIEVAWVVGLYVAAGLLFQFFTVDISVSTKKVNDDKDGSAGKEKLSALEDQSINTIDVLLEDYKLTLNKPGFFGRGALELQILKGVSARFESGKLNVIMGPSGSGKSSLLNLMARRLKSTLRTRYSFSGSMLFNGAMPSDTVIRSLCSYVTQDDDALLPSLTVRETLQYAAALRLPAWLPAKDKGRKAEEILLKMGLRDCADVIIGSEFMKGISGGQKRRVTIAVQILTEPRILLLDEPTSGLDAFTAASILTVLRGLADEGRTVICTIHQSRNDLFEKFGNVLLLARGGYTIYSGSAAKMLPYFSSIGHECPLNTNPADFALDVVTVDLQHENRERESRVKVQKLIQRFSHIEALADSAEAAKKRVVSLPAELRQIARGMAPFWVSYPILLKRSLLNIKRQPPLIVARIFQVLGLGVIATLFFAPLKNDYYAVQNRMGFSQQFCSLYFVGMLQNIAIYPYERNVFYKEHDDRAYSTTSFFLAYTTNELPFEVVTSLLFSLFADLVAGLPRTPQLFFIIAANVLCITNCGESIGIIFNTLFQHTGFTVNVTSSVLSIGVVMSGIMSTDMPEFLKAVNFISPIKYAMQNVVPYSLEGVKFTCKESQRLPGGKCPIETGEEVIALYRMDGHHPWKHLVALVAATVIYRLVAYIVVIMKRRQWGVGVRNG